MGLTYFKRYRMEVNVLDTPLHADRLPVGYHFVPWSPLLVRDHGRVKWESFRFEIDANVFPCLGDRDGCYNLMREISGRKTFVPESTWLVVYQPHPNHPAEACGTIQGLAIESGVGAIQNLGITPGHRGRGIGSALLLRCLSGFKAAGFQRVNLEVTVQNNSAVRLYKRLGFRTMETVFKVADVAMA